MKKTKAIIDIDHAMWLWSDDELVIIDYRDGDSGYEYLPNSGGACFFLWHEMTTPQKLDMIHSFSEELISNGMDESYVNSKFDTIGEVK